MLPLGPLIAGVLSRLLASRVGAGVLQAASRMKGLGAEMFAKAASKVPPAAPGGQGFASAGARNAAGAAASPQGFAQRATENVSKAFRDRMNQFSQRRPGPPPIPPPVINQTVKPPPVQPPPFAHPAAPTANNLGSIVSQRMATFQQTGQPQQGFQDSAQGPQQATGVGNVVKEIPFGETAAKSAKYLGGAFTFLAVTGKKLAEEQIKGLSHLRQFNGQIAAGYARLKQGDLQRARRTAAATADTTTALTDAMNELRDNIEPIKAFYINAVNLLLTPLLKAANQVFEIRAYVASWIGFDMSQRKSSQTGPWQSSLNDLAAMYRDRNDPKKNGPGQANSKGSKK